MALTKTVIEKHGFVANNAYHRVEDVHLESKTLMSLMIRSYVKRDEALYFHQSFIKCQYDIGGADPFAQGYKYLKKTEEFKDAIDS